MNKGAQFYKADLHIHSFGEGCGSFDVSDTTNTPEAIVDMAIAKGLKIISITDHNQYMNSMRAVEYAQGKNILVIPGIEISTTQGHLLLYFEGAEQLQQYFAILTFNADKTSCHQGIVECLRKAEQYDGIGVLAHITQASGFESIINRFNPTMEEIFKCKNLLGLEIVKKDDMILYTDEDDNVDHCRMLKVWRESNNDILHRNFAKLMSSDSHELNRLGKNAEGEERLTRIKMHTMTFLSLRHALQSNESRVRLEENIVEPRPIIKHIKLEGGLLDNLDIELSPNLTCIIGGRGTGKSTLLESIRVATGNNKESKLCDCEIWPQKIELDYLHSTRQIVTLQREKNGQVANKFDPMNGLINVPIECYGQGDTASTIQHSEENPQVIIDFLDSFLNIEMYKQKDMEFVNKLRENKSQMDRLRIEIKILPELKKALTNKETQIKEMEKSKVAEVVKLQNALIQEKEFRNSLKNDLNNLVSTYMNILGENDLFKNVAEMSGESIIIGKEYFENVKNIVGAFSSIVELKSQELNSELNVKINEIKEQLHLWTSKETQIQDKIDKKREEFKRQNIPFDLGKINQVSKDIVEYRKLIKERDSQVKRLEVLYDERKHLIQERQLNKNEIYREHLTFQQKINNTLRNSVDGLSVNIKYNVGVYSPDFEAKLKNFMGWRNSQIKKESIISHNVNVYDFVEAVKLKNKSVFQGLLNDGDRVFDDNDIERLFYTLNDDNKYEELEDVKYDDFPEITVTKFVDDNGQRKPIVRRIAKLSLGQQQSVLLAILLLSNSNIPLLIDQPEDNLDNEFIYKTIVANLRKIKENRQVIIVTHNPNIAILGDAELVIPLKSTNEKSFVVNAGSIDGEETIKECCSILEGGKSAFMLRKDMYGF